MMIRGAAPFWPPLHIEKRPEMTTWIRIVKTAVVAGTVAAAAAGATACGSADAQPSPEEKAAAAAAEAAPRVVTVTAHDYSFEAPAEVPDARS